METPDTKLVVRIQNHIGLFPKKTVTLLPGITVLVGCNGMGKTTLIDELYEALENRSDVTLSLYCNSRDGGRNGVDNLMYRGRTTEAIKANFLSEGEQIRNFFCDFIVNVGELHKKNPGTKKIIFLDGVDSGYSIDQILELKTFLHQLPDLTSVDTYIIVAANTFEFVREEQCLYVGTLKYVEQPFTDYEQYKKFIINSRKKKNNRKKH